MTTFQTKDFYVDSDRNCITSYTGQRSTTPSLYYKSYNLFRFTVLSDGLPLNLTGSTLTLQISYGYPVATQLVKSTDFFSSDWSDYNISTGHICCRVDLDVAAINTWLSTSKSKGAYTTLWAALGGVDYVLALFDTNIYQTLL